MDNSIDTSVRIFSQAVEDYVKAIFKLQSAHEKVSTNDLARKLRATPAAASKMMKHLADLRLIELVPYQGARLTDAGEKVALEIIRHHRLLEVYLHQALGYGWDEVDAEAEKLEHHISEEFEARIDALLDYPVVDPHGDPIPRRDGTMPPAPGKPLHDFNTGDRLVIRRVNDSDPDVLRYLAKLGMRLQVELEVTDKQPFNGPLAVRVGESEHAIGRELAGHVFVERCQLAEATV